jgi:hypothetical protein
MGRFRSFLLTAVRHLLANQSDRDRAAKRGGGQAHLPIDQRSDEDPSCVPEPSSAETPETIYEQRWALTVLDTAMARLERNCEADGTRVLFQTLRPFLTGDDPDSGRASDETIAVRRGGARMGRR